MEPPMALGEISMGAGHMIYGEIVTWERIT